MQSRRVVTLSTDVDFLQILAPRRFIAISKIFAMCRIIVTVIVTIALIMTPLRGRRAFGNGLTGAWRVCVPVEKGLKQRRRYDDVCTNNKVKKKKEPCVYEMTFLRAPFRPYCCRDMSALDEAAFTPYKEQIGANARASGAQSRVVRILFREFHAHMFII